MSDDLVKRYRQLQEVIGGCHDGYCVVRKPKGMHTNGGCTCLEDMRLHERSRIGGLLRCAQGMADRIEELEAKLAKAVEALERIGKGEFAGQMLMSLPPQDAGAHFARMTLAIIKLKGKCDD